MSLYINTNSMADRTANTLSQHYTKLAKSTQRLSTGLRINGASDDAAGLAIRELMRADLAAVGQGIRNANDAISMLQTADGALGIIDEKLIRMKELAEQASTGTYNSTQRMMIDSEFQQMASEIERIARATDFNGIKLLDGEWQSTSVSTTSDATYNYRTGSSLTEATGYSINSSSNNQNDVLEALKTNGSITDTPINVTLTNNITPITSSTGATFELTSSTNGSTLASTYGGHTFRLRGFGGGSWLVFDNDTSVGSAQYSESSGSLSLLLGSNTFTATLSASEDISGQTDFTFTMPSAANITSALSAQPDTTNGFTLTGASNLSITTSGNTYTVFFDVNGETFTQTVNFNKTATNYSLKSLSLNFSRSRIGSGESEPIPDDVVKIHFGPGNDSSEDYYYIDKRDVTLKGLGLIGVNIRTQEKAQSALEKIEDAIVKKDKVRAYYGAMQNRMENTVTNLQVQSENLQAAESRISDADVATEMMNFVRNQILSQSSVAMLAQANSFPQMAMSLIR